MNGSMNCELLILGGNGGVVNSLIPFLQGRSVIAGRTRPVITGNYEFISWDLESDHDRIFNVIGSVRTILNCIGYTGSDVTKYAVNLTSIRPIVQLATHYNCRLIHLSTIKCSHFDFIEHAHHHSSTPYSPYSWSKLGAELYLEKHWQNCSIVRLGFLKNTHCLQYYNHSRFLSNQPVQILTPEELWRIIAEESIQSSFRRVKASSYRQPLYAFAKELTGKRFIFPINSKLISIIARLIPTKLFDYCD
jgi:dTDP-4-dehydrorhamnose reductase